MISVRNRIHIRLFVVVALVCLFIVVLWYYPVPVLTVSIIV